MADPRMLRVYLSGPISGHDIAERRALFGVTADRLVACGLAVVNPMEVRPDKCAYATTCAADPSGHIWSCWMRHDIAALVTCDAVATLPGWEMSRGATIEVGLAESLGIPVLPVVQYLEGAR